MKRKNICSLALTLLMLLSCLCAAYADTGSVTYDGGARSFVFLPGSDYSPSDLPKKYFSFSQKTVPIYTPFFSY